MSVVSVAEMLACVDREIGLREKVYPRFVLSGKLTQVNANRELERMRAVRVAVARLEKMEATFRAMSSCRLRDWSVPAAQVTFHFASESELLGFMHAMDDGRGALVEHIAVTERTSRR